MIKNLRDKYVVPGFENLETFIEEQLEEKLNDKFNEFERRMNKNHEILFEKIKKLVKE